MLSKAARAGESLGQTLIRYQPNHTQDAPFQSLLPMTSRTCSTCTRTRTYTTWFRAWNPIQWKVGIISRPMLIQLRTLDHILENSHIDSPVTRLIVSQDPETKALVAAFLAADSLIIIEDSGTRKELGKVVKGKFVPDTSAQSILVGYIPVYVNWQGQYQGAMRSVNNNYWNLLGY